MAKANATCACGNNIVQTLGRGRPRKRCTTCSQPTRKPSVVAPVAKACLHCGSTFSGTDPAKYCSPVCKHRAAFDRAQRVLCSVCGKPTGHKVGRVETARHNACRRDQWEHGTKRGYDAGGCRCGECKAAKATAMRDYLAKRNARMAEYPQCKADGCERDARAIGMCQKHYTIWRKEQGTWKPSPSDRWDNPRNIARRRKREALKKNGMRDGEEFTIGTLLERDNHTCGICSARIDPDLRWPHPQSPSIDHVLPLSLGGPHTLDNTAPAHLRCNQSKGNRVDAHALRTA